MNPRQLYEEFFWSPWRHVVFREFREQRDAMFVMTCSDLVGIHNPAAFYTLELVPEVLEGFHDWHVRMGMERPPDGGFRCC